MTIELAKIISLGFVQLPNMDPEWFTHRKRIGSMVFVNTKHKLYYHLHTINAYTCLRSTAKLLRGERADRARDLQQALLQSSIADWDVYFKGGNEPKECRHEIISLLTGYTTLNTKSPRINTEEASRAYKVHFYDNDRTFLIVANKPLLKEEAIGAFLKKWRISLDAAINRRSVSLQAYYKGCTQLAAATKMWITGNHSDFKVEVVPALTGLTRKEIMRYVNVENSKTTIAYRTELQK